MSKLTSKETLIAYVSTLSEKRCKEAYQILTERFEIHRKKHLLFNRQGIEATAPTGKVRLTPREYQSILEEYGELGFHRLVELLYDYIVRLEERAEFEVVAKRRLKEYQKISHYYRMTKGWVAQRYEEENPVTKEGTGEDTTISFEQIKTKEQAIQYIESIPRHLRYDNMEVTFLVTEYGLEDV